MVLLTVHTSCMTGQVLHLVGDNGKVEFKENGNETEMEGWNGTNQWKMPDEGQHALLNPSAVFR